MIVSWHSSLCHAYFDHDVDISYSTREPAQIRDNMAGLGVTTMSAESKTEPGDTIPIRKLWNNSM